MMCYCCFSPDFLFHPLLFPNSNYTCSFFVSSSIFVTVENTAVIAEHHF